MKLKVAAVPRGALSAIICIVVVLELIMVSAPSTTVNGLESAKRGVAAPLASPTMSPTGGPSLAIGHYLRFGKLYGAPILWRVVHIDEAGDPILLADRILTIRSFDSAGDAHPDRSPDEMTLDRRNSGSAAWKHSNIRQWLNSSSERIDWTQNPPTGDNLYSEPGFARNAYDQEKGFLADGHFSATERSFIKPFRHKETLNEIDRTAKEGGEENYLFPSAPQHLLSHQLVSNLDTTYHRTVLDSVFLLSVKQWREWVWNHRRILGESFGKGRPTAQSIANSSFKHPRLKSSIFDPSGFKSSSTPGWEFWTSTPISDAEVLSISINQPPSRTRANDTSKGVRPALQLDRSATVFNRTGTGTEARPYQVYDGVDLEAPEAPVGINAPYVSSDRLVLSWKPAIDNVGTTAYEVYSGFKWMGTISDNRFELDTLTANTAYTFRIKAVDAANNKSGFSASFTVRTLQTPLLDRTSPSVPTKLSINQRLITSSKLILRWEASTDSGGSKLRGYYVYINDDQSLVHFVPPVAFPSYTFAWLTPSTEYTFRIVAIDYSGNLSDPSLPLEASTVADIIKPPTPTGLKVVGIGADQVSLSWDHVQDDSNISCSYEIVTDHGNTEVVIGTSPYDSSTYVKGLSNREYTFAVRAIDHAGNASALSRSISVTPRPDDTPPEAPTSIFASNVTYTGFFLNWSPSPDHPDGVRYLVKDDDDPYSDRIGTHESRMYIRFEIPVGETVTYRVYAMDNASPPNRSANAASITVKRPANERAPGAPTQMAATKVTDQSVTLHWRRFHNPSLIEQSFEISIDGVVIGHTSAETYTVGNLQPLTRYTFFVRSSTKFNGQDLYSVAGTTLSVTTGRPTAKPDSEADQQPLQSRISYSDFGNVLSQEFVLADEAIVTVRLLSPDHVPLATAINNLYMRPGTHHALFRNIRSYRDGHYSVHLIAQPLSSEERIEAFHAVSLDRSRPLVNQSSAGPLTDQTNPAIIRFNLSRNARVSAKVYDRTNTMKVRELSGWQDWGNSFYFNGGFNRFEWDGRNDLNQEVPDGDYVIRILAMNLFYSGVTTQSLKVKVERAIPIISNVSHTIGSIIGTRQQPTAIRYTLSEQAAVTVRILNAQQEPVRTLLDRSVRNAGAHLTLWNGKAGAENGLNVPPGTYTYVIDATDGAGKRATPVSGVLTVP